MSGRFHVTTKIRSSCKGTTALSSLHSLQPPFLGFSSFGRWPMEAQADFSRFPFVFDILSLGQHLLLVFTFSAPWVTFTLKHLRFWWLLSLFLCYSLLIFVCCTILSFQHQFELIWMVEFEFLLNPNSNSMGN